MGCGSSSHYHTESPNCARDGSQFTCMVLSACKKSNFFVRAYSLNVRTNSAVTDASSKIHKVKYSYLLETNASMRLDDHTLFRDRRSATFKLPTKITKGYVWALAFSKSAAALQTCELDLSENSSVGFVKLVNVCNKAIVIKNDPASPTDLVAMDILQFLLQHHATPPTFTKDCEVNKQRKDSVQCSPDMKCNTHKHTPCATSPTAAVQVRRSLDLCPEEEAYTKERLQTVRSNIETLLNEVFEGRDGPISISEDCTPNIAIAVSGGGYRTAVSSLGFMLGNLARRFERDSIKLMDISTQIAGVSGGCWLIGSLIAKSKEIALLLSRNTSGQIPPTMSQLLENYSHSLRYRLQRSPSESIIESPFEFVSDMSTIYQERRLYYNRTDLFSSVDAFGYLLGKRLLDYDPRHFMWTAINSTMPPAATERPERYLFSELLQSRVLPEYHDAEHKTTLPSCVQFPLPILTAATVHDVDEDMQWLEITPFETGVPRAEAFVPTTYFGHPFEGGQSLLSEAPLEKSLEYLLGIAGSAYAIPLHILIESTVPKPIGKMLTGMIRFLDLGNTAISPATVMNFMKGIEVDDDISYVSKDELLRIVDAGSIVNLPLVPLLRTQRKTDIIVVLDNSTTLQGFEQLKETARVVRDLYDQMGPDCIRPLPSFTTAPQSPQPPPAPREHMKTPPIPHAHNMQKLLLKQQSMAQVLGQRPSSEKYLHRSDIPDYAADPVPLLHTLKSESKQQQQQRPPTTQFTRSRSESRVIDHVQIFGLESYPSTPIVVYLRGPDKDKESEKHVYVRTSDLQYEAEQFDLLLNHSRNKAEVSATRELIAKAIRRVVAHRQPAAYRNAPQPLGRYRNRSTSSCSSSTSSISSSRSSQHP